MRLKEQDCVFEPYDDDSFSLGQSLDTGFSFDFYAP